MAYDFDRKFAQSESINFQFFSEEFNFSQTSQNILLSLHLGCLVLFLLFKWTNSSGLPSLFKEVRLWPLTFEHRKLNNYNTFMIIVVSNYIGMVFSRGTHQ
jgi:hypothetical protein